MKNDKININSVDKQHIISFICVIIFIFSVYLFGKNESTWLIFILVIFLFIAGYFIWNTVYNSYKMLGFKEWAKENKLKYEKEVKNSFFTLSAKSKIKDIIWGEINSKRIFLFNIQNLEENPPCGGENYMDYSRKIKFFSSFRTFYNGNLYKSLSVEELSSLIENTSSIKALELKKVISDEMISANEIVMLIMANIFLKIGEKVEFDVIKKVCKSIEKMGINKKAVCNGEESINSLSSRIGSAIDRDVIRNILNSCQYYKDEYALDLFEGLWKKF